MNVYQRIRIWLVVLLAVWLMGSLAFGQITFTGYTGGGANWTSSQGVASMSLTLGGPFGPSLQGQTFNYGEGCSTSGQLPGSYGNNPLGAFSGITVVYCGSGPGDGVPQTWYTPTNNPWSANPNPPLSLVPTYYPSVTSGGGAGLGLQNNSGGPAYFAPMITAPDGSVSQGPSQLVPAGGTAVPFSLGNVPSGDTVTWGDSLTPNGQYTPINTIGPGGGDDSPPNPYNIAETNIPPTTTLSSTPIPTGTTPPPVTLPPPTYGTSSPITNVDAQTGTQTITPAGTNTAGAGTVTSPYKPGGIGSSTGGLNGQNGTNGSNGTNGAVDPTLDAWATNSVNADSGSIYTPTNFSSVPWAMPVVAVTATTPSFTLPFSAFPGLGLADMTFDFGAASMPTFWPQFRALLLVFMSITFFILYVKKIKGMAE